MRLPRRARLVLPQILPKGRICLLNGFGASVGRNPRYRRPTGSVAWIKCSDERFCSERNPIEHRKNTPAFIDLPKPTDLSALLVLSVVFSGCNKRAAFDPPTAEMTIEGSSMEPSLHGERRVYRCDECKRIVLFTIDRASTHDSNQCPWCDRILRDDSVSPHEAVLPSQQVAVESVNADTNLRRYDKVVVFDGENHRHEVKRLIGFPNETVRFIEGDLWINGERMSKSMPQFLDQAVIVDQWLETIGDWQAPHSGFQYQSTSLWPRSDDLKTPHPRRS